MAGVDIQQFEYVLSPGDIDSIHTTTADTDTAIVEGYLRELAPTGARAVRTSLRRFLGALYRVAGLPIGDTLDYVTLNFSWSRLTPNMIAAVRGELAIKYSPATVNHVMAAVRGVARALWNADRLTDTVYQKIRGVRGVKGIRIPRGRNISADVMADMMRVCNAVIPIGIRDRAIMAVLFIGGLRVDELVTLSIGDYDRNTGRLVVMGKGDKQRAVYIGQAQYVVNEWIAVRNFAGVEHNGALFNPILKGGAVVDGEHLTTQAVYTMLRRRGARVGANITPHDFRRTCIGNMLSAGIDIARVAQHVGHSSVTTTARYDRRPEELLRAAVDDMPLPGLT